MGQSKNALGVPLVSGIYGMNLGANIRGRVVGRLTAMAIGATALIGAVAGMVMELNTGYFRILLIGISLASLGCSWYAHHRLPEGAGPPGA